MEEMNSVVSLPLRVRERKLGQLMWPIHWPGRPLGRVPLLPPRSLRPLPSPLHCLPPDGLAPPAYLPHEGNVEQVSSRAGNLSDPNVDPDFLSILVRIGYNKKVYTSQLSTQSRRDTLNSIAALTTRAPSSSSPGAGSSTDIASVRSDGEPRTTSDTESDTYRINTTGSARLIRIICVNKSWIFVLESIMNLISQGLHLSWIWFLKISRIQLKSSWLGLYSSPALTSMQKAILHRSCVLFTNADVAETRT